MLYCSLNEIKTLVERAARGAAMHHGLAQEASFAVGWLEKSSIPCLELFADLLDFNDELPYEQIKPIISSSIWQTPSGRSCPILTGATLSDHRDRFNNDNLLVIESLYFPVFIIPFIASLANYSHSSYRVKFDNEEFNVTSNGVLVNYNPNLRNQQPPQSVEINQDKENPCDIPDRTINTKITVKQSTWDKLNLFASRTYVPESEQSRALGAGDSSRS